MKNFFKKLFCSDSMSKNFSETVQRIGKNNAGFSLVELIVVIAIMAILAAVAVVGVSVYIPKAQKAADDQLLNEINKIFNAACLDNHLTPEEITSAEWDFENMTLKSVNGKEDHPVVESFLLLFDVKNPEFKVIKGLYFDKKVGKFVEGTILAIQGSNGKTYYYVADADKTKAFSNSIFVNGMGVDTTLGIMDQVGSFAQEFLLNGNSEALNTVLGSEDFTKAFAKYVGYTGDIADFYDWMAEEYPDEDVQRQMTSNALMLYSSEKSSELTNESVKDLLGQNNAKGNILANLTGPNPDTATAMAQTAAAYSLYTAFLYSQPETYTKDGKTRDQLIEDAKNDPISVLNGLDDPDFQNYINNSSDADIDGYLAAMGMMNEASGTGNGQGGTAAGDILTEGFNTPWMEDMMNQTSGN